MLPHPKTMALVYIVTSIQPIYWVPIYLLKLKFF